VSEQLEAEWRQLQGWLQRLHQATEPLAEFNRAMPARPMTDAEFGHLDTLIMLIELMRGWYAHAERMLEQAGSGKLYQGWRNDGGKVDVAVDEPDPERPGMRRTRPLGLGYQEELDWGHGGAGATALARLLLADCLGEEYLDRWDVAREFAGAVVAKLPKQRWTLDESTIRAWAQSGIERIG
jgi:hypothetical protein